MCRSPAQTIDSQPIKNTKVDEGKFDAENRRRAEKLLKKQYGLKPVDSWRKHKKALNAAKYYEELPVTEKVNSIPELKVPVETKPEPKITKSVKSNKKVSTISLPVIKPINNPESPITVLNTPLVEAVKKPIASVAPYQIVLPKQPNAIILQPERTIEKLNNPKTKQIQAAQNKIEKESSATLRSIVSKKSINEDDGLLTEYKYMKKKSKTERKASLPASTSQTVSLEMSLVVKPKVQTVERYSPPEIIKPKVQTRHNSPEMIKSKVQTVERFNSSEVTKAKVQQAMGKCNSPEIIKPKAQIVENCSKSLEVVEQKIVGECNLPEVTKQNANDVVPATIEKGKKEMLLLNNKPQVDQQPDVGKKITVLKRKSDEKCSDHSPTITNKHGSILHLISLKSIIYDIQRRKIISLA